MTRWRFPLRVGILLVSSGALLSGCDSKTKTSEQQAAVETNVEKESEEAAAVKAADAWLLLVDAGKYPQSWKDAAPLFKNAVTKEQWGAQVGAVRGPLGPVKKRTLMSAVPATTLPGAPDGHYVVIQYDTVFEHKKKAVETVTPMLDKSGQWRVAGYFVK